MAESASESVQEPCEDEQVVSHRAPCSVCLRQMPLKKDGAVRVHGPVRCRCLGSGKPPSSVAPRPPVPVSPPTHPTLPAGPRPLSSTATADRNVFLPPRVKILKRVPKASRDQAARKLATVLNEVTSKNDVSAWICLLHFASHCFRAPRRGGQRWSLARHVNRQIGEEIRPSAPLTTRPHPVQHRRHGLDPLFLASRVSTKLEEGDFKGAVRLACSEDSIAEEDESTIAALKSKHPSPHPDTSIPPHPQDAELEAALKVCEGDVSHAIQTFPKGSAGGPDGLRPQHLQDLTGTSAGRGGEMLMCALVDFTNLVLSGRIPDLVRPAFFGASLTALNKKDGGVRPIAVGCTLRRLVAKTASMAVMERMGSMLAPLQLGYGTALGAEAATHSARLYLQDLPPENVLLKLDFRNAFNSVRRDKVLEAAKLHTPEIFPYVFSCYSAPTTLYLPTTSLESAEGVQQGDPLGPLLFCLVIHPLILRLHSEFKVFYLDDGTLGGNEDEVLQDLLSIEQESSDLGLQLNHRKTELICNAPAGHEILQTAPDLCTVRPTDAMLLGSPIGQSPSVDSAICAKVNSLKVMGSRLCLLRKHDALLLLRHSFAIPKILYILRTAPCFLSPCLVLFDQELRSILSAVLNISLDSVSAWSQATLPVAYGGIGVRSAVQLAPSAFLASAAGSTNLIHQILPARMSHSYSYPAVEDAKRVWKSSHDQSPPPSPADVRQKAWDMPCVQSTYDILLDTATDPRARARLLAVAKKESGAWLNALPVSSLGLRMDDDIVRIAVGLRLGVPLCRPHRCHLCGSEVDELATHGLSCKRSQGRHSRHAAINTILQRSLASAQIPSTLEPAGLSRSDGKRPDGVTIPPWKTGRCLVWDVTCPDTYAASHVVQATSEAGAVAKGAEIKKRDKYQFLSQTHHFVPVAVETSGVFGPDAFELFREIGGRIRTLTLEKNSRAYLIQQVSVAIQRGNAASVLGTLCVNSCM